jgi:hypothetical protein
MPEWKRCSHYAGFKGSSALSVQLQTKSSELTYASQQLEWSSGKAERLIAQILQIIDSSRLLLLSAPKVRKNP